MEKLNTIWKQVLAEAKKEYEKIIYDNYFSSTKLVELSNSRAIVTTCERFSAVVLENETSFFEKLLLEIIGKEVKIEFIYEKEYENLIISAFGEIIEYNVNPKQKFDNFRINNQNADALAYATTVASFPGKIYNPLCIYGNCTTEKNHLLHAIGNQVKKTRYMNALYINSLKFNNFHKSDSDIQLKNQFNEYDVILIDQIELLDSNAKVVIFDTINSFVSNNKQVVFTSNTNSLQSTFKTCVSIPIHSSK